MAKVPYTPQPTNVARFLKHIQGAGVPPKVTQDYLGSVGFKSSNDRYLIPVMKAVDFIDANGAPTQRWRDYRDKGKARQVLGAAIQHAYSDLFATYPDADQKDVEALHNFFSAKTDLSDATLRLAVTTFRTLVADADFGTPPATHELLAPGGHVAGAESLLTKDRSAFQTVNLNIQLQLPATDDPSIYENLFAAMRKHLLDK